MVVTTWLGLEQFAGDEGEESEHQAGDEADKRGFSCMAREVLVEQYNVRGGDPHAVSPSEPWVRLLAFCACGYFLPVSPVPVQF